MEEKEWAQLIGVLIGGLLGYLGSFISHYLQTTEQIRTKRREIYSNWSGIYLEFCLCQYDFIDKKCKKLPRLEGFVNSHQEGTPQRMNSEKNLWECVQEMNALKDRMGELRHKLYAAEVMAIMNETSAKTRKSFLALNVEAPNVLADETLSNESRVMRMNGWYNQRYTACKQFAESLSGEQRHKKFFWIGFAAILFVVFWIGNRTHSAVDSFFGVTSNGNLVMQKKAR